MLMLSRLVVASTQHAEVYKKSFASRASCAVALGHGHCDKQYIRGTRSLSDLTFKVATRYTLQPHRRIADVRRRTHREGEISATATK
eukprot:CAMPEP_0195000970 /NCGR_PEP_ID=MMETSP0326_2-20130528/849_1 /TAXON_ID=2866 ORGANISM="Crypthecodinium cohnii, Strain Seligo" /NCGR_SAMPLE_ID=MMETSP0326_2 /ASSEMBLY_ACC=CAM_ASM_000348 /LENGTH=86 /DNA_ID=CAMNT_0040003001 /DNA_START=560 /DNA_END=817 /DNA_ORIENTATION=-